MSDPYVLQDDAPLPAGSRRRKRRFSGCLPILIFIAVAVLLLAAAGKYVVGPWFEDLFADPEDYPGPGTGEVMFVVDPGQSIPSMGDELEKLGVVASAEAFEEAADDERARGIQAGTYLLKEEMKASDVFEILVDPANLSQSTVTIPEGLRAVDIVDRIAENTDFTKKQVRQALDDVDALGLPGFARGNPEGYLFPATYPVTPDDTAESLLQDMVERWGQAAGDLDLEAAAADVREGYSPAEIMTVASLVQAEGRGRDMAKIAQVIYNRIENPGEAGQIGRLQIDATVDYALGRPLTVSLTQEERENTQSPYNTFLNAGLPPGPIGNPGEEAIDAALNPAQGGWYYYVTVNLNTGKTKFAETYDEFLQYQAELRSWCDDHPDVC
jgi:UPF0755 protein